MKKKRITRFENGEEENEGCREEEEEELKIWFSKLGFQSYFSDFMFLMFFLIIIKVILSFKTRFNYV